MIDSVEIENALNRINGDIFQEFCNHFLHIELNPNTTMPIGSVIGKEKSRKGIPDSYFTNSENELIFAEYTSRERLGKGQSFFKKLESDIKNCFNSSKTGLKNEEIDKVILCFTGRIKPDEMKKLEVLCKQHNSKCVLELKGIRDLAFAVMDYPILGTYIGFKVGTGQIQKPSEFIANYERKKISTPLSNTFIGRTKEIEEGLLKIVNSDILIIHGAPGTGKSKIAIELAKLYSNKNDFTFLCIGNRGIPIWEDLKIMLQKDKKYILLVDDANRLAKNFQWILCLFEERENNALKVVVTVRDYALPQVKSIAKNYNYSSLEIGILSNDEIKKIIQSKDFKIKEPSCIDRILKISQGNIRLAIMSAKVALKAKNIFILEDASQIYDEYFEPLFYEVAILKESTTLKSLAIISFFSKIDRKNRELCDLIFKNLEIEENMFWEICYTLHEFELVDLFEKQVVKISDQIFSTYIFYKSVIEKETLSFNFFLDNYLDYENRIRDTIVPIINTFNYKHIEEKLKPLILKKWLDIVKLQENQNSMKYLDLFWFYLSSQVINYLKKQIDNQLKEPLIEYRYSYELNEFSNGIGKDLELISRFKYHNDELFKDALELLFYYAIKVPSKMPAVIYICKEKFNFSRLGYLYGDRIQHILFDFLIEKAQRNINKTIFENVLIELLPSFLKIEYTEDESNGRAITIYSYHLRLSDSIKSFRAKCFQYLIQTGNKSNILKILYLLHYYEYKHSEEILKHDLQFIFQIINNFFSPEEFEDCYVLQNVLEGLNWLKVDYSNEIKKGYNSELFKLTEVLKRDRKRKRDLGWQEEEKIYQTELKIFCSDYDISKYDFLFTKVSLIFEHLKKLGQSNQTCQYENSLNIIFSNLSETDSNLFLKTLNLNLIKFRFNLNFGYIFNNFFQIAPHLYFELYKLILGLNENTKFCFHQALNINYVKEEHLSILYVNLLDSIKSINSQYIFWDLTFVSKYKVLKEEKDIYFEILEIALSKIKTEKVKISVGQQFLEKCFLFDNFSKETLIEAYIYSIDIEKHFDYDKKLLKTLLQHDSNIIIRLLKFYYKNRISYYDIEHKHYDFIWELENSEEIINSIFEYYINSETYYFSKSSISAFFPSLEDKNGMKALEFLETLIDDKYLNIKYMSVVFNIICYKYPKLKMNYLERFLKLTSDFKIFNNLEIIKRSNICTGSYIPLLEREKEIWENVISVLDRLPNRIEYYEHKEYANCQIGYCEIRIKEEMKREFYEDFN